MRSRLNLSRSWIFLTFRRALYSSLRMVANIRLHIVVTPPLVLLSMLLLYMHISRTVRTGLERVYAQKIPTSRATETEGTVDQTSLLNDYNILEKAIVTQHGNINEIRFDKKLELHRYEIREVSDTFDVLSCFDVERKFPVTIPANLPTIPVVAYPRSGNRYTRTCLRDICAENIKAYNKVHNTALCRNGPTIRKDTHDPDTIVQYKEGAILLIRNPRDVIVSNFFYQHCFKMDHDDSVVTEWIKNKNETWVKWIESSIEDWKATYLDWLEKSQRLLIVFTEDLVLSPVREFARMLVFVNQTVSFSAIQCNVYQKPWGRRKYLDFEPYLPQELIQPHIDILNKTLITRGVKSLPTYDKTYLEPS